LESTFPTYLLKLIQEKVSEEAAVAIGTHEGISVPNTSPQEISEWVE
jgi:hypothetical protein